MAVKKPSIFALLVLLLLLTPAMALQKVPGDIDGDMKVSAEEVKKAEDAFSKGSITEQNLTEIKHIHEAIPLQ